MSGQPEPPPAVVLVARADLLRDERRWAEAAAAYQAALEHDPTPAGIWVQLGHARKESGDLAGAEAAYRQALRLAPRQADTHLQLGHLLKLAGRRPEAVAAYARALEVDRGFTPALDELIALGEGWAAERASGLGLHLLGRLLQAAEGLQVTLGALQGVLPDAASLNSFPCSAYGLFRARHRLPPPPEPVPPLRWAVLALERPGGDPVALLRALAAQRPAPLAVTLAGADAATAAALSQVAFGGLACEVDLPPPEAPVALPACDWLLVVSTAALPDPEALGWLNWAAVQVGSSGIYADEEDAAGPILKAAPDPEAPPYRHALLAVRAGAAAASALAAADPLGALAATAAAAGGLAHLPRILCRRLAELPPAAAPVPLPAADPVQPRIAVVVPTRNGGALLAACLDALAATAAHPGSLDLVILDNGSDEAATLTLLEQRAAAGATVLGDPAPFNWSRLSNAGARASEAGILLFLNDDVVVTTPEWDVLLRRLLARPAVGAVGARLSYPEGGLQHAGMVLGPDGRAEHEGVAAIGVPAGIAERWTTRRRVAAVTGAMLACRRDAFEAVGGFDEADLPIWFNDVDFCLRLRRAGLVVLYAPALAGIHHESRSLSAAAEDPRRRAVWQESLAGMRRRWGQALSIDPGFNPHFARSGRPFEALAEPSPAAVRAHLLRSARPDPWALP